MSLSESQLNHPNFDECSTLANEALQHFAERMGVDVTDLGTESSLGFIVDKLTAAGLRARKLKK